MKKDSTPPVKVPVVYNAQEGHTVTLKGLTHVKSVKQEVSVMKDPWLGVLMELSRSLEQCLVSAVLLVPTPKFQVLKNLIL